MVSTWLVHLPREVTARIAAFISRGEQDRSLLNFAKADWSLCEAAFASLSNTITILPNRAEIFRWACLCPDAVDKVVFRSQEVDQALGEVLSETNIKTADVSGGMHEWITLCLSELKSLKKLTLRFIVAWEQIVDELLECLAKMDLEELELKCPDYFEDGHMEFCMYSHIRPYGAFCDKLQSCCPNLKVLKVSECMLMQHHDDPSPVIRELDSLESIVVFGDEMLRSLAERFPKVYGKSFMPNDLDEACSLGEKLLSLVTDKCLTKGLIANLASCTNLQEPEANVQIGCEEDLAHSLGAMESLRELRLLWGHVHRSGGSQFVTYAKTPPGSLLKIARALCNVKKLELGRIRASLHEWKAVLKCVGAKLERLCIWIQQQDECEWDRREAMILLVSKYCPMIRTYCEEDVGLSGHVSAHLHNRFRSAVDYYMGRCPYGTPPLEGTCAM